MNLSSLSIAAMLTAVLAVLVLRHSSLVSLSDQSHQHGTFVPIAANVFRLSYSWHIPWLGVWVCASVSTVLSSREDIASHCILLRLKQPYTQRFACVLATS